VENIINEMRNDLLEERLISNIFVGFQICVKAAQP